MKEYDILVIGAGPGGYPAAIRAAQLGAKTAIVEREWLGGTCLNCGCIPTKAIISGSELFERIKRADEWGINVGDVGFDYTQMSARKDKVIDGLRNGIAQLVKANKIDLYEGAASFKTPKVVAVAGQDGATQDLKAEKIIIATGSTSAMPSFLPQHERIIESRRFLELTKLPESMIVMGGGYIGCELACMAAALGVKVTVVEMLDDILTLLDKDVRRVVSRHMEKKLDIEILTGSPLENVAADSNGVTAESGGKKLSADLLLVATGRNPVTDGLALERSGIETDDRGYIPVDAYSRTRVSSIYAVGDVTGRIQLAHAATSQGVYAAETALGHAARKSEILIPGVIFTTPEVAVAGLTESEAQAEGRDVKIGKFSFNALGKALASNDTDGFVKLVIDSSNDQIIGAQAVGAHATDLIAEACLAIRAELTAAELGNTVHGHPTFAESWMEAAHVAHGACIHAPPKRR